MTVVQRENLPDVAGEEKAPPDNRFAIDNDFCEKNWMDSFENEGLSKVISARRPCPAAGERRTML